MKYPWAHCRELESEWVLLAIDSTLEFHHKGVVSKIYGRDVEKITVRRRKGAVVEINVFYGEQITRLQYYDQMEELLRFMIQISTVAEIVELGSP